MQKPKDTKKKELSPNHINHVKNMLRVFKGSSLTHPLAVPPSPSADTGADDQLIPAKTGEYVIPKPVVDRKGTQFFDNLVKKTLEELMPADAAAQGGTGTAETGFKWGGEVGRGNQESEPWQEPTPLPSPSPNPQGNPDPNVFINREPRWNQSGLDPRTGQNFFSSNPWFNPNTNMTFGYNPFGMSKNFPNSTQIPTFWDHQGYPFAVPVAQGSPDYGSSGPHPHTPPKSNS